MGPICDGCPHNKTHSCIAFCDVDYNVANGATYCYIRRIEEERDRLAQEVEDSKSAWTTVKIMREAIREAFPNIGDGCDQPSVLLNEVAKLKLRVREADTGAGKSSEERLNELEAYIRNEEQKPKTGFELTVEEERDYLRRRLTVIEKMIYTKRPGSMTLYELIMSLNDELEYLRIPLDADGIRATASDGSIHISWYDDPKDAPEWWGKPLGFTTRVGDQHYAERIAKIINTLWAQVKAAKR